MMKRLALIALGFASAAGCAATVRTQPTYASHEPEPYRTERRPVREEPINRPDSRWVTIADRYSADNDRQFIAVNGGEFRKLRVEAVRGAPVIHKVAVEFVNDSNVQVIDFNARLRDGQGQNIDLNGGRRQIKRIVVYTEPGNGGAYSIYGA